jgi:4-hydroxy-tetrahydrodipicolinate reductase
MLNVLITAPRGKMGRLNVQAAVKSEDIRLVGCIGPAGRDYIGKDAGLVSGMGEPCGALCYGDIEEIIGDCDMVIDFSTVALSREMIHACVRHKKALICGTTGFGEEDTAIFAETAKKIPLLKAANTSYMSNVMTEMVKLAAKALKDQCKVEIIDYHDEKKVDAPSGTAKEFGETISEASGKDISEIDFHSIRAGDISSTHTILFGAMGERLEVTHRTYNWECCARGAMEAARFLAGKPVGAYTMEDVIRIGD